jgi:hypothetical protein
MRLPALIDDSTPQETGILPQVFDVLCFDGYGMATLTRSVVALFRCDWGVFMEPLNLAIPLVLGVLICLTSRDFVADVLVAAEGGHSVANSGTYRLGDWAHNSNELLMAISVQPFCIESIGGHILCCIR